MSFVELGLRFKVSPLIEERVGLALMECLLGVHLKSHGNGPVLNGLTSFNVFFNVH